MKIIGMRNRLVCVAGIVAALLGLAQAANATLVTTVTSTNMGAYTHYVYAFTTDVNLSNASGTWTVPAGISSIQLLVVAGGGAGGEGDDWNRQYGGGGGGAGGLIYNASYSVTPGATLNIQVGGGGVRAQHTFGGNGGNSIFADQTAYGGGGGAASWDSTVGRWQSDQVGGAGGDGGSGGGGAGVGGYGPGDGTPGQGYNGTAYYSQLLSGGGGGAGGLAPYNAGGIGREFSQFASLGVGVGRGDPAYPGWFAGGGGPWVQHSSHYTNAGGKGGGGYGAYSYSRAAASGATGTGGGGGGGAGGTLAPDYIAGNGGSGIVILAYDQFIPEPSTMLLLALGGAFVWRARRIGRC